MRWTTLPDHLRARVRSEVGGGLEKFAPAPNKPRSKYRNSKEERDGYLFDSKKEAAYYDYLKLRLRNHEIEEFRIQVPFVLQEGFKAINGVSIRPIVYVADFLVRFPGGKEQVIDVKGFRTEVYKIKKKMFLKKYPNHYFLEV